MTNFELAQALVRLGAVSASALDGGGSSAMAFNGSLLSRPSGSEQATSTALQLMYYGVYAPTPDPFISPNGDGVAEKQRALSYKVVRPSNVTATLVGPGDVSAFTETVDRVPGTYPVAFPPTPLDPTLPPSGRGRWRLDVQQPTTSARPRPRARRSRSTRHSGSRSCRAVAVVRVRGKQGFRQVTLTRPARVFATVETVSGVRVAAIACAPSAGRFIARWKGTTLGGRSFVYGGLYKIGSAHQRARRRGAHDPAFA
jgi:hypothetical protein